MFLCFALAGFILGKYADQLFGGDKRGQQRAA